MSHEPRRPGLQAGRGHDDDASGPHQLVYQLEEDTRILNVLDYVSEDANVIVISFGQVGDIAADDAAAVSQPFSCASAS
jgi:hypothetical protein